MAASQQYVTLGAGKEVFAAPVEKVQEVLELRPITQLPRSPANLLGMIDVRSQGIPVIDLRSTLGMPPAADDHNTRIVVLSLGTPERALKVALKTDRVFEVTTLDEDELDQAPDLGLAWDVRAVAGLGRRNGTFVTVLDLDHLFGSPQIPTTV